MDFRGWAERLYLAMMRRIGHNDVIRLLGNLLPGLDIGHFIFVQPLQHLLAVPFRQIVKRSFGRIFAHIIRPRDAGHAKIAANRVDMVEKRRRRHDRQAFP